MDLVGKAKRVRIYIGEAEMIGHRPADAVIVEWLRRENAQGATVLRGVSGFGATGEIHVSNLVDVAQNLPMHRRVGRHGRRRGEAPSAAEAAGAPRADHGGRHRRLCCTSLTPSRPAADGHRRGGDVTRGVRGREGRAVATGRRSHAGEDVPGGPRRGGRVPVGIITNGRSRAEGRPRVRVELLENLDKPEVHAVLERLAAGNKVAADVMTSGPVTIEAAAALPRAAEVMTHRRLKRLPVVDEHGALVGMLSRVDLLRTAAGGLERKAMTAREMGLAGDTPLARVMRRDIPTVHPDTALPEVFQAIVSTRLNRALVVDSDHRVVGLVTDAELLERLTPSLRPGALRRAHAPAPVRSPEGRGGDRGTACAGASRGRPDVDVTSPTASEDTLLSDAITSMLKGGHKVLAVTDHEGRLVGMVDCADLLHGLVRPPSGT